MDGNTNILIVVDQFSGFTILVPAKSLTSLELSQTLLTVLALLPIPKRIYTDLGTAFTAEVFEQLLTLLKIKHVKISSKNPRSNAQGERKIAEVKMRLRALLNSEKDIINNLPLVSMQLNTTVCSVRKRQPMEIIFGESYSRPCFEDITVPRTLPLSATEFLENAKRKMAEMWQNVKENLDTAKLRDKKAYDKCFRTTEPNWRVGQAVLLDKRGIPAHSD